MPDYFLGIDIGGTSVKIGLIDSSGELLGTTKEETRPQEGPRRLVSAAMSAGRRLAEELGLPWGAVKAVGVGCAGLISLRGGMLITSPNLPGWDEVPLGGMLADACDVDVFLDNDANALAYGESRLGAATGRSFVVFLTLGTGVGGGLLLGGEVYRGFNGFGPELGHVVIDTDGPVCGCGNRGCLESFVRSKTIVETALEYYRKAGKMDELARIAGGSAEAVTPECLSKAATNGDAVAAHVFRETGRWLGIAVGGFINIFNPQVVVIGGGVAQAGDKLFEPVRHWAGRYAFSSSFNSAIIVPASLGENAGLIGAALEARDGCGIPCG